MRLTTTQTISGVTVTPGAQIPYSPQLAIPLSVWTICKSMDPEQWVGEVRLGRDVVFTTEPVSDHNQAGKQAEQGFYASLAAVLRIT